MIELQNSENHVNMIITDNGFGIKDEIIHKIYDPFFTSYLEEKTGLTLSVVKKVIEENHEGKISCESNGF